MKLLIHRDRLSKIYKKQKMIYPPDPDGALVPRRVKLDMPGNKLHTALIKEFFRNELNRSE